MMDVIFSKEIIKELAENLIIFYFTNNYSNETSKINHVKKSMKDYSIIIENKVLGSNISGHTHGSKIFLCVPNGTITEENVPKVLETLIHELFHKISKNSFEKKSIFLEEGYVSYFTSLVVEYAKNNKNISKPLRNILERVKTENGYLVESSFVRSCQLIFDYYGIDGKMDYLFSSNGVDLLKRKARLINKEYSTLFHNARNKSVALSAVLLPYEEEILKKELEKVPLSNITKVELEMNQVLASFLTSKKEDIEVLNPLLLNNKLLNYEIRTKEEIEVFKKDSTKLPFDIPNISYDFSLSLEEKTVIWNRLLSSVADRLRAVSLGINPENNIAIDFITIIFAEDILKSGKKDDLENVLKSYCKAVGFDKYPNIMESLRFKVLYYISELEKSNDNLNKFIEDTMLQLFNYNLKVRDALDDITSNNCFEVVEKFANLGKKLKEKYHTETSYSLFYNIPLLTSCFFKNKSFDKKEYNSYLEKLESSTSKFMLPPSVIGNGKDSIFFHAIIKSIANNNNKFSVDDYFTWFDEINPDLGKYHGDNDYELFAYILYSDFVSLLKNPKISSEEKINLIVDFIKHDYRDNKSNSKFDYIHAIRIGKYGKYAVKNTFIEQMVAISISYLLQVINDKKNKNVLLSLMNENEEVSLYLFNNSKFLNRIVERECFNEQNNSKIVSSYDIERKMFDKQLIFSKKMDKLDKSVPKDSITYRLFVDHYVEESKRMLKLDVSEFVDRYSIFCNMGLEKEANVLKDEFLSKVSQEKNIFKEHEILPCLEFLFLDLSKNGEDSILIKDKSLVSSLFSEVDNLLDEYQKKNEKVSLTKLRNVLEKINFLSSMYEVNNEKKVK